MSLATSTTTVAADLAAGEVVSLATSTTTIAADLAAGEVVSLSVVLLPPLRLGQCRL